MMNSNARRIVSCFMLAGTMGVLSACVGKVGVSSSSNASSVKAGASSSPTVSSVRSVSSVGATSSSGSVFVPPVEQPSGPETLVMAINAGGPAATLDGISYQADAYFTGGTTYVGNVDIIGTAEDAVYLSERYEDSSYSIPVSNGNYTVAFNFSETYHKVAGERVFNVAIEGTTMLSNVDIFKTVGINTPMIERVNNVAVSDGKLDIKFQGVTANAKVTGIVIYKADKVVTHADKGKEIFDKQCKGCHEATTKGVGTKVDESGHDLQSLTVATDSMPPGAPEACDAECAYYTAKYIASVNPFFGRAKPGEGLVVPKGLVDSPPPVMGRLNADEYNNTIRDLFGITTNPANDFPADNSTLFNNDHAVLTMSSLHVEKFNDAAIKIATAVVNAASTGTRTAITCDLTATTCAQTVITQLGLKVWRRPVSTEETTALKSVYDTTQSKTNDRKASMTALLRAMLLSPNFLFRPEFDQNLSARQAQPLSAYELASRLSYFLWASTPDDQLLAKAANGSLTTDATLKAEVTRMLADARSSTLVDDFAASWLGYNALNDIQFDKNLYPNFNDTIRAAFIKETQAFMSYIIKEGRPISEIFDANYTFLNEDLAKYYGVQGITGSNMRLYTWPAGSKRLGLLGHGSSLAAHSHPDKTSPVKRGVWVMDKFLCERPPEPSAEVLAAFPVVPAGLNPRARAEFHKESSTACASCHLYVDPIGFGMENFNPVAQWQDLYPNGDRVDPSSKLPTGEVFNSQVELANILAKKPEITLCTASFLTTYATGRNLNTLKPSDNEATDYPAMYQILEKAKDSNYSIKTVINEIVLSPIFRMRRGANSQ